MNVVSKAATFAAKAHKGQKRKYTGKPYFTHCEAVAQIVAQYGGSDAMIAAAYLHDTLEDTATTYKTLASYFGTQVADLVLAVTDVSKPSDGTRAARKALDLQHLAQASPDAQTIKLADLIHNTSSIVDFDPDFAKTYLAEKAALLKVLTKGDKRLHAIASQYV